MSDYGDMTPAELAMHVEEFNHRKEVESDEAFALAYYNAAWQRSKRMPRLKKLLEDRQKLRQEQQKPKQQSANDLLAMAMRLNAANGGIVKGGATLGSSS